MTAMKALTVLRLSSDGPIRLKSAAAFAAVLLHGLLPSLTSLDLSGAVMEWEGWKEGGKRSFGVIVEGLVSPLFSFSLV